MNTYNPIREILIEALMGFFKNSPAEKAWAGTATQLFRLLQSNPMNDGMLKRIDSLRVREVLQDMAKEGIIQSETDAGLWSIPRSTFQLFKVIHAGSPAVGWFSERELLAIMSAIVFDTYSGPSTPEKSVATARKILHEIDNTTR